MDRSTVPTLLDQSRVRVSPGFETFPFPHPTLKFNVYSHKRGPTILAKNGVIHLVSAPLFPPWTVLNELFVFPGAFAGLTNAVQKVGLDEPLLPPNDADAKLPDDFAGSPFVQGVLEELAAEKGLDSFTVFAPSNAAFARLGWRINGFLHSPLPFARKVLKYLLAYHVVPGVRFYSDFLHNDSSIASDASKYIVKEEIDVEVPLEWVTDSHGESSAWPLPPFPGRRPADDRPHPPPHAPEHPHTGPRANITHYVLPTLLTEHVPDATLKVGVVSYRSFFGKGPIRRNVIVFPSHGHHHERHAADEGEADFERGWAHDGDDDHGRIPRRHPVKVAFTDVPARAGAIQVRTSHRASLASLADESCRWLWYHSHRSLAATSSSRRLRLTRSTTAQTSTPTTSSRSRRKRPGASPRQFTNSLPELPSPSSENHQCKRLVQPFLRLERACVLSLLCLPFSCSHVLVRLLSKHNSQ